MTYKELLEKLKTYSDEELSKNFLLYVIEDDEFYDPDFVEIEKASDQLNDNDATYLVI
tara:strand:+ start:465 stop:638 length:174 start_codon:yes stop_codon:yes gene_type:complete